MNETTGNIWDHLGTAIICITTNGHLTKKGEAVLGRGCAWQDVRPLLADILDDRFTVITAP